MKMGCIKNIPPSIPTHHTKPLKRAKKPFWTSSIVITLTLFLLVTERHPEKQKPLLRPCWRKTPPSRPLTSLSPRLGPVFIQLHKTPLKNFPNWTSQLGVPYPSQDEYKTPWRNW